MGKIHGRTFGKGGQKKEGEHTSSMNPDRRSRLELALERLHDVVVDGNVAVAGGWERGEPGRGRGRVGS